MDQDIAQTPVVQVPLAQNLPENLSGAHCNQCHIEVRSTDYFCFNCGKNLKPKPLAIDAMTQILYYGGSVLLPPMGIIWGLRYLKEKNPTAKIVGIVCIVITIIVIIVAVQATLQLIKSISDQVNTGTANMMQF